MSEPKIGEGLYKDTYLKEVDREFISGIGWAIESLDEFDTDAFLTGYSSIDTVVKEIIWKVMDGIKNHLIECQMETTLAMIEDYDEDYISACEEREREVEKND